jgi:hypothetical protein
MTVNIFYAEDPNKQPVPLLVDAQGNLLVAQYQPPNTPLGIVDRIATFNSYNSLPAGSSDFAQTTVPANQIWHISQISMIYAGTITGVTILAKFFNGSALQTFTSTISPVNGAVNIIIVDLYMKAGDYLNFTIRGAHLGDSAQFQYYGYRIL